MFFSWSFTLTQYPLFFSYQIHEVFLQYFSISSRYSHSSMRLYSVIKIRLLSLLSSLISLFLWCMLSSNSIFYPLQPFSPSWLTQLPEISFQIFMSTSLNDSPILIPRSEPYLSSIFYRNTGRCLLYRRRSHCLGYFLLDFEFYESILMYFSNPVLNYQYVDVAGSLNLKVSKVPA